jgi:hypothetical protein
LEDVQYLWIEDERDDAEDKYGGGTNHETRARFGQVFGQCHTGSGFTKS